MSPFSDNSNKWNHKSVAIISSRTKAKEAAAITTTVVVEIRVDARVTGHE